MIDALNLFGNIKAALSHGGEVNFREFLRCRAATKWTIAADFVINDRDACHDVFALTVFPYDMDIDEKIAEIRAVLYKDIKRLKTLSEDMLEYIAGEGHFSFCFLFDKSRFVFASPERCRKSIDVSIRTMCDWQDAELHQGVVNQFRKLRQEAAANSFNHRLFLDICILCVLLASISFLIQKHTRADVIGFFPDRDKMTEAYSSIYIEMALINHSSFCQAEGVRLEGTKFGQATAHGTKPGSDAWFDALVRIPDFLAGALSRWDLRENRFSGTHAKYSQVLSGSIADNPRVIVTRLSFSIFGARPFAVISRLREARPDRPGLLPDISKSIEYHLSGNFKKLDPKRPFARQSLRTSTAATLIALVNGDKVDGRRTAFLREEVADRVIEILSSLLVTPSRMRI